jgi:hypothetical protein
MNRFLEREIRQLQLEVRRLKEEVQEMEEGDSSLSLKYSRRIAVLANLLYPRVCLFTETGERG